MSIKNHTPTISHTIVCVYKIIGLVCTYEVKFELTRLSTIQAHVTLPQIAYHMNCLSLNCCFVQFTGHHNWKRPRTGSHTQYFDDIWILYHRQLKIAPITRCAFKCNIRHQIGYRVYAVAFGHPQADDLLLWDVDDVVVDGMYRPT